MNFIPETANIAAFTLAAIILILSPGPNMALILGKSVTIGRKAGFATFAGTTTGSIIHSVLASLGISTLLAASPIAFSILKIIGITYLLWLAYKAIRYGSAIDVGETSKRSETYYKSWLNGFVINLINPKAVLFFVTFLPQFISVNDPYAGQKLLFLGLYLCLLALPFYIVAILMASQFSKFLKTSTNAIRIFDYLFASLIGIFALRMLSAKSS